jgi:peptide/nickel transport system permease protein
MVGFVGRRLLNVPLLLVLATLLAFVVLQSGPGNVVDNQTRSADLSPRQVEQYIAEFGLDKPVIVQYVDWLGRAAVGDLGRSLATSRPVTEVVARPIQNSMVLVLSSLVVVYALANILGVYGAMRENSVADRISSAIAYVFVGLPSFFLAMVVIYLLLRFKFWTGVFLLPVGGMTSNEFELFSPLRQALDIAWHAIAPVLCISLIQIAALSRLVRAQVSEVLGQDFIRTARAKGVSERAVVYRHALKNALVPFVASLGTLLPALVGGAGLVEVVFNWPGITPLVLNAIGFKDFFVFIAVVSFSAVLLIVGNLIADLLLLIVDPRIRYR